MTEAAVRLEGVSKTYHRGGESLRVLAGLDLEVASGEFLALMGPSGSGKSTLLNLVGGLDRIDAGRIAVAGQELSGLTESALARWRSRSVGFVFQGFNLIPVLSALENVELPLVLAPLSRKQRREHAEYALELVGLADRASHRPAQLSGGQEQRVAIARAIVSDPAVLLADEPTGDLDRASAESVMELMERLNRELEKTILVVTHDGRAAEHAGRVLHLDKGVMETVTETIKS
ncbi:MAG: ABC transporter ATP-binding protein [Planctomycetota bacterium]|jgi:putative ABC transport system ATP-binding protein|nr:ABC transporter ATP-binding protein [Planctomycetota bacterium]MDP6370561.1 ABC transporter ATP-binding protein [Planctomycetota bacterium]MDP6837899.1 ABC transporter ATP-binding protein [Planctomycetota bacterium]MDP6954411.1 ABC transporter ATP-binding protein [Planctomycetota bacterium]